MDITLSVKQITHLISTMQKQDDDKTEREMFDLIKMISEFKFPSAKYLMKERLYRADIVELSKKAKYKFIKKG